MFNTTLAAPPTEKRQPLYGLIKAKIGSQHVVKCKDGKKRIFTVREQRLHTEAKTVARCLHPECMGREWPSLKALEKDHEAAEVMARQQEKHVFALFSEDALPTNPHYDAMHLASLDAKGHIVGLLMSE